MLLLAILLVAGRGSCRKATRTTSRPSRRRSAPRLRAPGLRVSFIPVVRTIMAIADRYFDSPPTASMRLPFIGHGARHGRSIGTMFLAVLIGDQPRPGRARSAPQFLLPRPVQRPPGRRTPTRSGISSSGSSCRSPRASSSPRSTEVYVQYVAAHPLARLAEPATTSSEWLGGGTHYRMQLAGEGRQPRPAHRGGPRKYIDQDLEPVDQPAEPGGDPGLVRRHPVGDLGAASLPGHGHAVPGPPGLGRDRLRGRSAPGSRT